MSLNACGVLLRNCKQASKQQLSYNLAHQNEQLALNLTVLSHFCLAANEVVHKVLLITLDGMKSS